MIIEGFKQLTKYLSLLSSPSSRKDALSDAYRIYGDGVARMIPKRLVERSTFQENLAAIDELEINSEREKVNDVDKGA